MMQPLFFTKTISVKSIFNKCFYSNFEYKVFIMQDIEPFYNWRHLYIAEEDRLSPFFKRSYSEFEYSQTIYNFYIHPQWDDIGSRTLYLKTLYADYEQHFVIIELLGEWNDAIENDIMTLRRNITDVLYKKGIYKFILIAENVLNFHSSDDSYYEEWQEQVMDDNGWITILNMPAHNKIEFKKARLTTYVEFMEVLQWRSLKPELLFQEIDKFYLKRIQ